MGVCLVGGAICKFQIEAGVCLVGGGCIEQFEVRVSILDGGPFLEVGVQTPLHTMTVPYQIASYHKSSNKSPGVYLH